MSIPKWQGEDDDASYMSECSDSADDGACTVLTLGRGETPTALMGYSIAAKAKAKAKPTSAPAVAPTGGASSSSGRPAYQGPVSYQFQNTRCRSPSPRVLPRRTPLIHHWLRNVLSALILHDKVALHIPSRKLAVIVAIQLWKEEMTSGNIHSRVALANSRKFQEYFRDLLQTVWMFHQ